MEIIQSVGTAIEIVKKLKELSKKVSDADFNMLLADLTSELADAKLAAANLKTELAEVKSELQDLKDRQSIKETRQPSYVDGGYRFDGDSGLYCTGCFDSVGKQIRLAQSEKGFDDVFGKWHCPVCKQYFS